MKSRISQLSPRHPYLVVVYVAAFMFLLTGCFCKECADANTLINKQQPSDLAAVKQVVAEVKTEVPAAPVVKGPALTEEKTEMPALRDFSDRFVFRMAKDCPLGIKSIRSHVTAGPNVSFKSAGEDVYEGGSHKPGIGFQVGFGSTFRFNDQWSVSSSLLYKQNRASEEVEINDGYEPGQEPTGGYSIKDRYSYSYLSAPIVGQYNFSDNLSVSAGPEINYLLKAKVKSEVDYPGGQGGEENTEDISDNSVKLGVGVQLGVKYQIPDSRWGVQVIYDHRLSRLNKKNPEGYGNYEVPAWRMKSVQVGVTCLICDLVKGKK